MQAGDSEIEGRSDAELMAAYVAGDQAAFRALFARLAPQLHRIAVYQLARSEDANDLVQQTFLHLHRARRDYQAGAPVKPWLVTILLNLKRDLLRRGARRPEHPLREAEPGDHRVELANGERRARGGDVRAAIAKLPEAQAEVIVLHWFGGLSFPEVARVVGASLSAVKVRAHRGYARLRTILDEIGNRRGGSGVQGIGR